MNATSPRSKVPAAALAATVLLATLAFFFFRARGAAEAEAYVLGRVGEDLGTDLIEDAVPTAAFRIELEQLGLEHLSAARIDLDRDGRIDQHWTFFSDGRIRRALSSNDDGVFDRREQRLDGEWLPAGEEEEETTVGAEAIGELEELMRELPTAGEGAGESSSAESRARSDAEIYLLMQQGRDLEVPLMRDAQPGASWSVSLFRTDGATVITGAHLDLDRDGELDQRWTYGENERITRELVRGDTVLERQRWTEEGWQTL